MHVLRIFMCHVTVADIFNFAEDEFDPEPEVQLQGKTLTTSTNIKRHSLFGVV